MSILYGQVKARYTHGEKDGDDPDVLPDETPVEGRVEFRPSLDGRATSVALRASGEGGPRTLVLTPQNFEIKQSVLVDGSNRAGVWLVREVDGVPVYWTAAVTLKDPDGRSILSRTLTLGPSSWIAGEVDLLIDLSNLLDTPPTSGSALAIATESAQAAADRAEQAAAAVTVVTPIGLDEVRAALAARHHRRVTILSIGDSWAEPMGQTEASMSLPAQLARAIDSAPKTFVRAEWSELVPWRDQQLEMSGESSPATYPTVPWAREWGDGASMTVKFEHDPIDFVDIHWWGYYPDGSSYYAPGFQWRARGESDWQTVGDWGDANVGWDNDGGKYYRHRVRVWGWPGIEIKPATGGGGADGTGPGRDRFCFLGVTLAARSPDIGVTSLNLAVSGTDTNYWVNRIGAAAIENTVLGSWKPDVVHISCTGNDFQQGVPLAAYKANLSAIIAHYRELADREIPVIFTTQSLPDISHPGIDQTVWESYRAASREAVEAAGGWWADIGEFLGPMSELTAPDRRDWGADFGDRFDDVHLSNLGAGRAANHLARLIG